MDWSGPVIGAAIEVHRVLGPGLLESAYAESLAHELAERRIPHAREVSLPLVYKGTRLDASYRLDFVVAECLLVELKAVESLHPIHTAQVITYMKLGGFAQALLLNFNAPRLKDGLKRLLL
jgi:GxxExxY protein